MEVKNVGNLKFSNVEYKETLNKIYAFVTCVDTDEIEKKCYWGEVDNRNNPEQIRHIMLFGARWRQSE